jgi:putative ABC transport system permease protein
MIKHWKYTLINIFGLSIGLTSFVFTFLYIKDELRYDHYHEKAERIYRVNRLYASNNIEEDASTCSFPCGPALKRDHPDLIEEAVRFSNIQTQEMLLAYNKKDDTIQFNESYFYFVDSNVFNVFTFPFISGDPNTALKYPNSVVITQSTANRYFGEDSAIGKTLRLEEHIDLEVTGIIEDIPSNSHFKIDFLASMSTYREIQGTDAPDKLLGALTRYRQTKVNRYPDYWVWNPCWTYILLRKNVTENELTERFPEFYDTHYGVFKNDEITLYLQPVKNIHLYSNHAYEMHPNSDIVYIYILFSIAAIVLILACINFMNLTTACAYTRIQEIGMKKVHGAIRQNLIFNYLGETFFQTFLALFISVAIVEFFLPLFNGFTGKSIQSPFIFEPNVWGAVVIVTILITLLSGLYPSYFLTSFKPINLCKGLPSKGKGTIKPRKILVIGQFAISTSMIIGTLLIFSQLNFLKNAKLGYNTEQIIVFRSEGKLLENYVDFKQDLLLNKNIVNVTGMEDILGVNHNTRAYQIEGVDKESFIYVPTFLVEWDFIETFDIEVLEGRSFSENFPDDNTKAVMINETMAENMLWTNSDAIGKPFRSEFGEEEVIGVFKNFHVLSLHHPLNNFVIDMYTEPEKFARVIAVRMNEKNQTKTLSYISNVWKKYNPTRPFSYEFLKDYHKKLYENETKLGDLSVMLTILTILIATIGLIGLTSFMAEQRTKNVSIRKVHGANFYSILNLMFNEFTRLILFANLISWPVTYIILYLWLKGYTRHVEINLWIFVISGLLTLMLALLIVGHRSWRIYLRNPAETLRHHF